MMETCHHPTIVTGDTHGHQLKVLHFTTCVQTLPTDLSPPLQLSPLKTADFRGVKKSKLKFGKLFWSGIISDGSPDCL